MSQNLHNPFALPSPAFLNARVSNPVANNFGTTQQQTFVPGLPTLSKPSFTSAPNWQITNAVQNHTRRYPSYPNHQPRHPNHGNQFRGYARHPFNSSPRTHHVQASPQRDFQNFPFFCNRCDRSFKLEEQYNEHVKEHVTCGIDGCTFVSHPKIVEKHIAMQHETGLALKIMSLNTPEDIAKWREERKKRFPTAAKVSEKIAAKEEQTKRGELLDDQPERFPIRTREKGRGRGRGRGVRSGRGRSGNEFRENVSHVTSKSDVKRAPNSTIKKDLQSEQAEKCPEIAQEDQRKGNLPAFGGTASYLGLPKTLSQSKRDSTIEDHISDEDMDIDAKIESTTQENGDVPISQISDNKPLIGTSEALSAILGSYASDSDESLEEGELKEEAEDKNLETLSQVAASDDVCMPVAKEDKTHGEHGVSLKSNKRKRKRGKRGNAEEIPTSSHVKVPNAPIRRKRLTLLQKLLQGEIRHERNVILQCVHYVVQNNFFGIGE